MGGKGIFGVVGLCACLAAAAGCGKTSGCGCDDEEAMIRYQDAHPAARGLAHGPAASPRAATRTDAVEDVPHWFALGAALAADAAAPSDAADEPATQPFVPWSQRRGPAYPDDWLRSIGRDAKEILPTVWDDTKATFTNPIALVAFGAAGAAGIVLSASEADAEIADHYTRHGSQLPHWLEELGETGGNPGIHFAVAGVMYVGGLAAKDVKTYETSKTLISALSINGLFTLALKGLVRTRSPNGDPWGWPSGHTSSSFCFATVMYKAYGPVVGVPLLAFASFVGYERVDARNHDFSDVISGALIGLAIGYVVGENHEMKLFGFDVVPYTDPARGGFGLALSRKW